MLGLSLMVIHPQIVYAEEANPLIDTRDLYAKAEFVVHGMVIRVDKTPTKTTAVWAIQTRYKGELPELITVMSDSGKVRINQKEPDFAPYDQAILYLVKDGNAYRCINGRYGKKEIANDNVYLDPHNSFNTIKKVEYIKLLESLAGITG